MSNGQKSVPTGTAEQVDASETYFYGLKLKAHPENTATIYVGETSGVTTSTGYPLSPGQEWPPDGMVDAPAVLALIWCISGTGGQKIAWTVET